MTRINMEKENKSRFRALSLLAAGILLPAMLLGGCDGGTPQIEASGSVELAVGEQSDEFLDRISSEQNVTENDAYRGILMLISGKDEEQDFAGRVTRLHEMGIIPSRWTCKADKPITRGRLAYVVYQADGFPGGMILTLTGPSERYCLREMRYREMIMAGTEFAPVSGMEYVAVLSRADAYRRTGKVPNRAGATD